MSASCDTTSFARRRRAASSARCLGPPRSSVRPSSTASSGPRIRNSMPLMTPLLPRTDSARARRPAHGATDCRWFATESQPSRPTLTPPAAEGRSPNGGGAMLHRIVKRLTTGAAVTLTALVAIGRSGGGGRRRPARRPRDARPGSDRTDQRLGDVPRRRAARRPRRCTGPARSWRLSETSSCAPTIAPIAAFPPMRPLRSRRPARASTGSTPGSARRRRSGSCCSPRAPR